ncbi:MAG TPA: hypothetical protein VMA95_07320 [Streptosporangiaceae bacterium]|nr:hypothetical protein [Streptosporangiaceae bacterium]
MTVNWSPRGTEAAHPVAVAAVVAALGLVCTALTCSALLSQEAAPAAPARFSITATASTSTAPDPGPAPRWLNPAEERLWGSSPLPRAGRLEGTVPVTALAAR